MRQLDRALVNTINARNVAVAERIDAVYLSSAPTPSEKILDFDSVLAVADELVGREAVFAEIETFRAGHDRGYFDVVAEAGLGKTALAAAITRRHDAVCFFASANRGLRRADQFLTHASAALVVKYQIEHDRLPENVGSDATFFTKVLREAATRLAPGGALWIVVDALDEAEPPADEANPLLLPDELPKSVYFVVTRRPGPALSTAPNTPVEQYTIHRDGADQDASIDAYLRRQSQPSSRVRQVLAAAKPPVPVEEFVARLKAASERNFMYLSYVIEDVANRKPDDPPFDLNTLPKGLSGYYERFWSRLQEVKAEGWAEWNGLYRPVIERLGVAFEPVPADWLGRQIGRTTEEVSERALERWQRLLGREQRNGIDLWRLVHRTFADFLATKVDLGAAHLAVGNSYTVGLRGDWANWDRYGLEHTISHYAEAARRSKPSERRPIVANLVSLVTDTEFQKTSLDRLADPTQVERDLELALRTASEDEQNPTVFLLAEVALPLVTFRRQERQPRPIFDLAQRGELAAAERRLDLFAPDLDEDWHDALLLTIAWLGAAKKPPEARRLFDRVDVNSSGSPTLSLLVAHVAAVLHQTAPPLVPLDPPAPPPVAEAIVARLSGSTYDTSLLGEFGSELLYRRGNAQGDDTFYLAHQDGQPLVALAHVDPPHGEPLLRRYVDIHAGYGYRQYRNGSLWALLDAVLRHPQPDWVRTWLPILGEAVLAPIRGEFQEALELAALGQRALLADTDALAALDGRADAALEATEGLRTGEKGGQGDVWGTHKRRLAALAETLVRVPNRHLQAFELIGRALEIQFGFAGFTAPAALRLAESVHITTPGDALTINRALDAALTSAHNINDPTFCARTTARVNAIRESWWRSLPVGLPDLPAAAERLRKDSATSEFAARHHIGENFAGRDPERTVPMPEHVLGAATLPQLASAYERPVSDFRRLNPGLPEDQPLPPGTPVNVPDPGFAPLMATFLAAQALVAPSLSETERAGVVRTLVPVVSRDVTALDTILARLLHSSPAPDLEALKRLHQLAALSSAETLDFESPPSGELSALPA
ncbi:MAG: hypothetical protein HY329_16735 [Chloroflexi bacterium]|nr:hypothetical protein [Chloroflexota bacterium]